MTCQTKFKRYEIKYLLTTEVKQALLFAMEPYMRLDQYGRTIIRNVYFDTDNFRLIRRSLEKPAYKEKLRVRSYRLADKNDIVFVELKKKYKSVVYKRRLPLLESQVIESFRYDLPLPVKSQVADEIEYFRSYYTGLHPTVFLSYEREAFYSLDESDFRVTFDENILYRNHDFSLGSETYGTSLLKEGQSLMEIKTTGGIPLWMCDELNKHKIFHTSFSKYGLAYKDMMFKSNTLRRRNHVF